MSDSPQNLNGIESDDPKAANRLLPLVYDELRRLAAVQMAREKPGQTLDATALVHEACLKLVGVGSFATKSQFFRAAAQAMRRILIDHVRAKKSDKRGGGWRRIELSKADRVIIPDCRCQNLRRNISGFNDSWANGPSKGNAAWGRISRS